MFMRKPSPTHTTGEDIFNLTDLYKAEKGLAGNNMLMFAQMVHDQWLGKCMISMHMLKVITPECTSIHCIIHCQALAVKDSKCTENGVGQGSKDGKFHKIKPTEFKKFSECFVMK
jgi:hypothetical protein